VRKDLIDKTISLYTTVGWKRWFSRIRFWDAPYIETEKLVPSKGTIVDLGCGEGIFTNFLALSSKQRKIVGIELNKERVSQADRRLTNVSFKKGDATKVAIPKADCIILFHLLHHLLSFKDQEKVIARCARALAKRGKLIIVEVNVKPTFKYLVSWFTDHFVVPFLFDKKFYESDIYFRKIADWKKLFAKYNLGCEVILAEKNKPFSHVIFVIQR